VEETEDETPASAPPERAGAQKPGGLAARLGQALAVAPTGAPDRPLLEAVLVFAAFYLVSFAPIDPAAAGSGLGTAAYHGLLLLELAPKALLVLYLMARSDGLVAFDVMAPRLSDLYRGLGAAIGAAAAVLAPALVFSALGWRNPLLEGALAPRDPAFFLLPLIVLSSLAVGYGEELFFRSYLVRRLRQAGLPPPWAALASTLVFGSAHGIQGLPGILAATLLGGWLAWRWLEDRDLHEIAIGHAIYDAAVVIATLYA